MTQVEAIAKLEAEGWEFSNWISAHDPMNEEARIAVMSKTPKPYVHYYREVNPDGTVI